MYPADTGSPHQSSRHQGQQPGNRHSWDPAAAAPQQYRTDQPYPPPPQHLNGAYPPRPDHQQPLSSASSTARSDRPDMAAIHHHPYPYHQQPAPYQLPAPQGLYAAPPPQDYRPAPHQPPQQQQAGQSAPRQRTAIACKYCRRRKIRCSGFENSEDGRCSNCIRFSQECVFTPVSAQTQAFVPAQALYGRARGQPQQLYGPYGNRLPAAPHDPYAQPPPGHHPGYTLPSPTGPYPPPPPGQGYAYPPVPAPGYDQGPRRRDEPPPNPDQRDPRGAHPPPPGYAYPDPQYAPGPPPPAGYQPPHQPYYSEPPRRHSPNSAYSYDPSRQSQSPHGPSYGYPPSSGPGQPPYSAAPGQAQTATTRTPPPPLAERGRSGMSIHDIVGSDAGGSGERSHADNDMVSKLNRPNQR